MKRAVLAFSFLAVVQFMFVSCRDTGVKNMTEESTSKIQEEIDDGIISKEAIEEAIEIEAAAEKAVREAAKKANVSIEKIVLQKA